MESNSNTIVHSKSCDTDDKVQIKEEPIHHNEINELLPHNQNYFELVPEKNELIVYDTKVDIKQEPRHLNKTTVFKTEMQGPPNSESTAAIKSEVDIKEETLWHYTSSIEVSASVTHAGSQNEEKLVNGEKKETLDSPRSPTETIYQDDNSITLLDEGEDVTSGKTESGSPTRQKICSLNFHLACDCEHYESEKDRNKGARVYKCEICKKSYSHKSSLKNHKKLHSGTTPHKCDKCQKCFTQKSDLQRHKYLHSGTKPYKCDICEKGFTQKTILQSHILLHSGIKQHKCDMCGKSYTRKSELQKHILLHSGTKPYKCEQCDKCFTQKSHLYRHKLLHSGTRPHKCDACGKYFTRISHLRRHCLQHV